MLIYILICYQIKVIKVELNNNFNNNEQGSLNLSKTKSSTSLKYHTDINKSPNKRSPGVSQERESIQSFNPTHITKDDPKR